MSRSGYCEDLEDNTLHLWRDAVKKGIEGKRGQAFLKELLIALDAMPVKELIPEQLVTPQGEVCAIGSVMVSRGIDATNIDVHDPDCIAKKMGISQALVREIEWINDEAVFLHLSSNIQLNTCERRWQIVRNWVVRHIYGERHEDGKL